MQVIVTSYCRLKYLRRCVESLRRDPVSVYVVDGGSDQETREFIRENADGFLLFDGNPGADYLKTAGIKQFVTDPAFLITSDDMVFPEGFSGLILEQYRRLNHRGLRWSFVACNMQYIENMLPASAWKSVEGVEIYPVNTSQVAGAVIDTELCRAVGYFPVYGRSGQGDWAFSKRLRDRGIHMGYLRRPMIDHIGGDKWRDFPEYSAAFQEDEDRWKQSAQNDDGNVLH